MSSPRSVFRVAAESRVAIIRRRAERAGMGERAIRRALRAAFRELLADTPRSLPKRPLACWHRAVRDVFGVGVLSIRGFPHPRQKSFSFTKETRRRAS